jgi:hypothetical protein
MKTIQYGQHPFVTADPIADELLHYAEVLATRQRSAIVEIPVILDGAASMARFLIGHGIPLASIPGTPDSSSTGHGHVRGRDEFGSSGTDVDPAEAVIGELVTHRSTHVLIEATKLARADGTPEWDRDAPAADESEQPGARTDDEGADHDSIRGTVTSITDGTPPRRARAERFEQGDDRS